ncbi:hypothetical protein CYMTET_30043 [Cymbomonas tetramitiformis]|uniref:Solute carrier family 40 protein n=1 Tax=Cymbomonas tetramitiformis TaxID=36881 RepID=A0AAE0KUK4_9CHLO|nr:hypothetical protein CYMTET_30043 [Cymbomonas tetramitiformis]
MAKKSEALLHLIISLAFFVQGVCVATLTPDGQISFTINHTKYSDDGTTARRRKREVCEFNVVSMVYFYLMTSAAQHAAQANVAYFCSDVLKAYREGFGVNWIRWSDYVLSAPVMMVVVGVVNGIFDMFTLVSLFGAVMITIVLGVVSDVCATLARAPLNDNASNSAVCAVAASRSNVPAPDGEALPRIGTLLIQSWFVALAGVTFYVEDARLPTYTTVVAYIVTMYLAFALWATRNGMRRADTIVTLAQSDARVYARTLFFLGTVPCVYA